LAIGKILGMILSLESSATVSKRKISPSSFGSALLNLRLKIGQEILLELNFSSCGGLSCHFGKSEIFDFGTKFFLKMSITF